MILDRIKSQVKLNQRHDNDFLKNELERDLFILTNLLGKTVMKPDPILLLIRDNSKKFMKELYKFEDYDKIKEDNKKKLIKMAKNYC